ncbi:class I SAM-dependent methyltransferase [Phytoactinopolyspora mesophila]|uniref:Methyltransferase domain-containing protein n=1 Tax=Phytoactinopolyspora mesophila TaxID=2650750 RepID=A0A7K3LXU3_9ACTN|nr:class I SAM-dependent methyltransferase [Phytoactinopolyspora mesophila]NDL55667.1 methyltransferase domain-containing protein [Phytoactinopolyspora mesophila]
MTPTATNAAYDSIAHWYDNLVGNAHTAHDDPYFTPLLDLAGDLANQRICDLACGQGRISRTLATHGANVVGIDASAELLTIAARYNSDHRSVEYRHDNAHTLDSCQDAEFDGVICNMALLDIPDLTATISSTYRILRPGGWFAFSTFHPCFNAPRSAELIDDTGHHHRTVTDYFTEGFWTSDRRTGPPRIVGAHHRTLTTYLNTLINAGFTLRHIQEVPGPTPGWQQVPPVLAAIADKPSQ